MKIHLNAVFAWALFQDFNEDLAFPRENHVAMIALFHMHYNLARIHQTLRVTAAMEAGLSQHVWSIHEIVALTIESEQVKAA